MVVLARVDHRVSLCLCGGVCYRADHRFNFASPVRLSGRRELRFFIQPLSVNLHTERGSKFGHFPRGIVRKTVPRRKRNSKPNRSSLLRRESPAVCVVVFRLHEAQNVVHEKDKLCQQQKDYKRATKEACSVCYRAEGADISSQTNAVAIGKTTPPQRETIC